MRKALLSSIALCFTLSLAAQGPVMKVEQRQKTVSKVRHHQHIDPVNSGSLVSTGSHETPKWLPQQKNTNIVSVMDIGTSANAYGYYAGTRTMVWHDRNLNAVVNLHRMGGAGDPGGYSGDLGIDFSMDGGNTWTNDYEIYIAENNSGGTYYTDAARYPHGGIFNPSGGNDPNNAWFVYFAPVLEGTNDGWGGYAYGVVNMGDMTVRTKNLLSSPTGMYLGLPSGFDITNEHVFALDVNEDIAGAAYQGNVILSKGTWNSDLNDFEYTQYLIDHFTDADLGAPYDAKIAFAADGQTGYISLLSDDGSAEAISGFKGGYPVIYKTTDAGESWTDLGGLQLGGPNGFSTIVNDLLTDEMIAQLYEEPLPARTEIPYCVAFDHDIAVDANGNLHIAAVVGVTGSDPYSISTGIPYSLATYDFYTTDGGDTWHAVKLGAIRMFRGTFGDISEDNRAQISASADGQTMVVTWLDTDLEDVLDNSRPNVFARGLKPNPWGTADLTCVNGVGEPTNTTLFSVAMWNATFMCASPITREGTDGRYYVPMVYQALQDGSDVLPTQFKYIKDFYYTDADFCIVGVDEPQAGNQFKIEQNYPNPVVNGQTQIRLSLEKGGNVQASVYNVNGQKVVEFNEGYLAAGDHSIKLNLNHLKAGIYSYSINVNGQTASRKFVVE